MRILLHDNSGHAFPVHLSRWFVGNGHEVVHLYSTSFESPRGGLTLRADDPQGLKIRGIDLGEKVQKYNYIRRRQQERHYGRLLSNEIQRYHPDWVLMCNTPIDIQLHAQRIAGKMKIPYLFWVQDIYSIAMNKILRKKLGFIGALVSKYYTMKERQLLKASTQVVIITHDFIPLLHSWGIPEEICSVVPNWAPLEDLPMMPKENAWSERYGLTNKFVFGYLGTLGLKHSPKVLLNLAIQLKEFPNCVVVVISDGIGAAWLREQTNRFKLNNLLVLGFQLYEDLPLVLGAVDVCVALLDSDAGVYSVPSKILSYLCSGRPLLLAVPEENLAAKIVCENEAGIVVDPKSESTFLDAALLLYHNEDLCRRFGQNARRYAETTFSIDRIGSQFESILHRR